jgi:hypothetical protein
MMPGFVDVTHMSDLEIKRLGQQDDHDEYQPRQRQARPASRQFPVDTVWAAACAAQRINGEYLKEGKNTYGDQGQVLGTKMRNRDLMPEFLHNPDRLLPEDIEAAKQCQNFLRNDLTFRALKGRLTDFDQSVSKVLAVTDAFDTVRHRYELAVVACLPQSHQRAMARQEQQQRLRSARGGLIGQPGDKIMTTVEVVSATYSQQYGIHWIRAVTQEDQPVFFSNRARFEPGTRITIKGAVKAHKDGVTQLNYVKVI